MTFAKEMLETKRELEGMGHEVLVSSDTQMIADGAHNSDDFEANLKHCIENDIIRNFFRQTEASDALLVLNKPKNGINGYVGANTLVDMGIAYYLRKMIFLLNKPPSTDELRHSHEIMTMQPVVLNGDLSKIPMKAK